jgi:hypothetical protein
MTPEYLDMMWTRNRFQQTILELGFNFLFTVILSIDHSSLGSMVQIAHHGALNCFSGH